jgi:hypothetical protein
MDEMIFGILEDNEGNIWFGASGIYKYNGSIIESFKEKEIQI